MTDQELLILAILLQTERYGYEIDRILSEDRMSLWGSVSRSSIYAVLTRLYRRRLVAYREVPQSGRPPRKLYSITEAGRVELEGMIGRGLSADNRVLGRFEIVLLAWPTLSENERKKLISSYIEKLKERESGLREAVRESISPTEAAFFERPLSLITAEIAWLLGFAEQSGITMGN